MVSTDIIQQFFGLWCFSKAYTYSKITNSWDLFYRFFQGNLGLKPMFIAYLNQSRVTTKQAQLIRNWVPIYLWYSCEPLWGSRCQLFIITLYIFNLKYRASHLQLKIMCSKIWYQGWRKQGGKLSGAALLLTTPDFETFRQTSYQRSLNEALCVLQTYFRISL